MRIGPLFVLGLLIAPLAISDTQPVDAAPEGQITWASQVTVVPGWFDPGEASVGSASIVLYALHGAPVRAEDVKFSFERYRGTDHKPFKDAVAAVEVLDPSRVRFRLKRPWPDFLTFYGGAGTAGWIVPKSYVEKVGDQGFKRAPIGAGPYKFVSFTPGVELVLEAFDGYWRK